MSFRPVKTKKTDTHSSVCLFSFGFSTVLSLCSTVFPQTYLRLLTGSGVAASCGRYRQCLNRKKQGVSRSAPSEWDDILRAKRVTRFCQRQVLIFLTDTLLPLLSSWGRCNQIVMCRWQMKHHHEQRSGQRQLPQSKSKILPAPSRREPLLQAVMNLEPQECVS